MQHRPLLFAIAYRMLGSVMDAEDAVQDAWLRFSAAGPDEVRSSRSFLATVVTRLCLDRLKSARAKRETYVGQWLPEPLVTAVDPAPSPEAQLEERESLSMAFLVLLESLSPLERAAFLLHDVFEFDFGEIAEILDRRAVACRQLCHRARQHVEEHRPRYQATPEQVQRLALAFIAASATGDLDGLIRLLADDVTFWGDGGGRAAAALNPIHGAVNVAKLLVGIVEKSPPGLSVAAGELNGAPAIVLYAGDEPFGVLIVDADGERARGLYSVVNPDKLRHLRRTA
jgi:RNA polymerase sigma-70 factor (ECF subfamily)